MDVHQENLSSLVESFKGAVERDKRPASAQLREEALTGVWESARIREAIRKEILSLADVFRNTLKEPDDFKVRVGRIALAMYFTDKIQELAAEVGKRKNSSLTALFHEARKEVSEMLSDSFFSKLPEQIEGDYRGVEFTLVPCAASCYIRLLTLKEACKAYQPKVEAAVLEELKS